MEGLDIPVAISCKKEHLVAFATKFGILSLIRYVAAYGLICTYYMGKKHAMSFTANFIVHL